MPEGGKGLLEKYLSRGIRMVLCLDDVYNLFRDTNEAVPVINHLQWI